MLVDLVPIHEAYHSVKEIGLRKEFFVHFGPRTASAGIADDYGADEVVCEELDWLPFYPGYANTVKSSHGSKSDGPPNMEAIPKALVVCSHWIWSFIKHSKWLENPSNVNAAKFLSKGDELPQTKAREPVEKSKSNRNVLKEDIDSFDQALENVEEALVRLENLLHELHVCRSSSEKEQLKAACSELERNRKLKKEAEFLEASFRAKAESLQQLMATNLSLQNNEQTRSAKGKSKSRGLWNFPVPPLAKKPERENESIERRDKSHVDIADLDLNEFHRFEVLRSELMELEKRVQKRTHLSENEEVSLNHMLFVHHKDWKWFLGSTGFGSNFFPFILLIIQEIKVHGGQVSGTALVTVPKNENLIEKSLDKLKSTSTLLAIDTVAAMGLMRRAIIDDELTEKEKRALKRTLADLASVVPIGVLMLLPVTAVGHAAMLAAIQRYVLGLEWLDLLRKLQKMKETEAGDAKLGQNIEELTS
ncbi:hypothetical protein AKJ16_DCAP11781 [Drosera capensis]